MKTYKVGLLVDGYEQPGWMHEMVEWLVHSQDFELAALLVMDGEAPDSAPRLGVKALFGTLSRLEGKMLPQKQRAMLACRDMREHLPQSGTSVIALAPGDEDAQARAEVQALGLDLVITLGASLATRAQMASW